MARRQAAGSAAQGARASGVVVAERQAGGRQRPPGTDRRAGRTAGERARGMTNWATIAQRGSPCPSFPTRRTWKTSDSGGPETLPQGFYIDVGANHPRIDSVTLAFYERGWRGINIEPLPHLPRAGRERPEDLNLNLAIGERESAHALRDGRLGSLHPGPRASPPAPGRGAARPPARSEGQHPGRDLRGPCRGRSTSSRSTSKGWKARCSAAST